jgi:hypothetical protein
MAAGVARDRARADGARIFYCGGGTSGKVRAVASREVGLGARQELLLKEIPPHLSLPSFDSQHYLYLVSIVGTVHSGTCAARSR